MAVAAYHQMDDEVLIRSPSGSVLCHTTGSRYRPVSVAGVITDAKVTLAIEGNVRRRLIDDQLDGSPRLRASPRILADLDPTQSQLVERRPCSADAYDGLLRGRTPAIAELVPTEVIDEVAFAIVKPPCSTIEQPKLRRVSSRGAWEGCLRKHRRDASQRGRRGRRRRSSSSSSSSESPGGSRSPLATPLHCIMGWIVPGGLTAVAITVHRHDSGVRRETERREPCSRPDHLRAETITCRRMRQMNLDAQENSRERYVTFSLREPKPGEVRFNVAGPTALLDVAQLLILHGGTEVSRLIPEKFFLLHLLIGKLGPVVGAAQGLVICQLSKPADIRGLSRLVTYQQGLATREREHVREGSRRSVDRISPVELSPEPELPRFSDRTVMQRDVPVNRLAGQRGSPAVHESIRARD